MSSPQIVSSGGGRAPRRLLFALTLASLAGACAPPLSRLPAEGDDPPALLAVYDLYRGGAGRATDRRRFYLWRQADRVVQATAGSPSLRVWQRNPAGRISHLEVDLDQRLVVEYTFGDLRMLDALPAWEELQGLVARELLDVPLAPRAARRYRGVEAYGLAGSVGRTDVEAAWLPSLHLAAQLRERGRDGEETRRLTLRQVYSLDRAPWRPPDLKTFRTIDFADLGDAPPGLISRHAGHE